MLVAGGGILLLALALCAMSPEGSSWQIFAGLFLLDATGPTTVAQWSLASGFVFATAAAWVWRFVRHPALRSPAA